MISQRPGESIHSMKLRALKGENDMRLHVHRTNDAAYQSQGRPNESKKGNWKFPGTGSGDTQDAENAVSVGTLPEPEPNSHYELRDLETGEIEIVLVSDMPDQEPTPPNQTTDRYNTHRLHSVDGDPMLKRMNKANRDFWAKRR